MAIEILKEVHADVEKAKTIEAGFAAFVRGFVTRMRIALGDAYDGDAKAMMDEAGNNADSFGAAIKAGTKEDAPAAPAPGAPAKA